MFLNALFCSLAAVLLFVSPSFAGDKYPEALPDLRVSKGNNNIAEAWLSQPTKRYQHFVLGSSYEAGAVNVRLRNGKTLTHVLDRKSVFEDRVARLRDLDGDGKDEVIVVRAYLKSGAALSVYGVKNNQLQLLAETPDMGHPFGWLNPAGIADFDGDGKLEIAFVRKPHVLGQLELWEYSTGSLRLDMQVGGTSNHAIGSKSLGLSAVADFNGDGVMDLAIPSRGQSALRFFSFKGGVKQISKKALPVRASSDFSVVKRNGKNAVRVGLANGKSLVVSP